MEFSNYNGYFQADGTEFVVTKPDTPRAFDNFLWNRVLFSNVQQTGVGYIDYQVDEREAMQLLTGVGRICDFDLFGRDHLMSRIVYVRDNQTGEYWTVNWEPVCRPYTFYQCVHGMGYTEITSETCGIRSTFRIFVPAGEDPVELWSLSFADVSGRARDLSVFLYNQFQFRFKWGFDSYGDMIFRHSYLDTDLNAVIAVKHPHTRPHNHLTGFVASDTPIAAFDGVRDAFVGGYRTLKEPLAVENGHCSNTEGSADATIAALQFDFSLPANESKKMDVMIGAADEPANVAALSGKYLGNFAMYFAQLKEEKQALAARNRVCTPDKQFDVMQNIWVKQAVMYGAAWCRWGWNGYRDIVQHGLGVAPLCPQRTRDILTEALGYQYASGLAICGWNPIDEKPYSDSALWLVFTLTAYLKETGDMAFLEQQAPYYDGGSATVLQHIETALAFLEQNKGAHGLVLIKFGDWNDSLTGVGKEGRGESVWLSEAYAEAMLQMAELFTYLKDDARSTAYRERYDRIREAINRNAWDGAWYVRCYDDSGRAIGSHNNEQGKIFIESQAWALIAGICEGARTQQVLDACEAYLGSPLGYRMLSPAFTHEDEGIGRISCMEPGIAENGTIYSHTNIWMVLGLIRQGRPAEAYALLKKIMPGQYGDENDPKRSCPPYMYANCYFGPDHRNHRYQMEFTWITGSVAWFHTVLLQDMAGVKPGYGGLEICPCLPPAWDSCTVERQFRGEQYCISISNPNHIAGGRTAITVDGVPLDGTVLPMFGDGKVHRVQVAVLPPADGAR